LRGDWTARRRPEIQLREEPLTMIRLIGLICVFAFSVGGAFAQQAAYDIAPPPGWQVKDKGSVFVFTPPDDPSGNTALTMIPVLPVGSSFDAMFNVERGIMEKTMNLKPINVIKPVRQTVMGGDTELVGGAYTNGKQNFMVVFMGRGENGVMGMGVLISSDLKKAQEHLKQASGVLSAMRLTRQAPALAAANGAAILKQAQAQQPQQPRQQGQKAPARPAQQAPKPPAANNNSGYVWTPTTHYTGHGMDIW
jgi:hypothetical protein